MVRAKVKRIYSPDVEDLRSFASGDNSFRFLLTLFVGPADSEGEESFDVVVCTPEWLLANVKEDEVLFLNPYVLMKAYNYDLLLNKVVGRIEGIFGKDWKEVAEKISAFTHWEFAGYRSKVAVYSG